ncbi:MAG TPA: tRNA lysidine(34) synthetase TilS [Candidatus Limnocylindria bacterium]|nr:tRNA lysidine(34) synthetase TilS [Candidatus Limnocylindria bacterium]
MHDQTASPKPRSATSVDPVDRLAAAVASGADALAIPDGSALLLAVSGGPDSMALLHGTARLASGRRWQLTVAHLDHALRDGSSEDAAFVAAAAEALDLGWEVRRTDVRALAAGEGRTLEDAGRQARYRFFEEIASPGALIATAHTADDSAETIVLNLLRGSGLAGVGGIPARRDRVVRPLLTARRADLRADLDAAAILYRLDPSNADPSFARNRVRHEVLPVLERLNPAAAEALLRFGRLAADDDAALDGIAAAELDRRRMADGIDWRNPPTRAIGRRILRLAVGDPAPSAQRIEALLDAAEGSRGGVTVELGGNREASVRGRIIHLR